MVKVLLRPYSAFINAYLPNQVKPSFSHRLFPPLSRCGVQTCRDMQRGRALLCVKKLVWTWKRESGLASRVVA